MEHILIYPGDSILYRFNVSGVAKPKLRKKEDLKHQGFKLAFFKLFLSILGQDAVSVGFSGENRIILSSLTIYSGIATPRNASNVLVFFPLQRPPVAITSNFP